MSAKQPAIAVIGAGIGGLAVAAALRRINVECTIYEQARAFAPVGAGIQLTANAMKALKGLSLDAELRRVGFAPRLGLSRDWDTGRITNTVEMGTAIEAKYGVPDLAMHRSHLHRVLAAAVCEDSVRFDKRLVALERTGERVQLTFADGERVVADAVVGADGLHSTVREFLLGAEAPHFTGKVAYRAVLPTSLVRGVEMDERVKYWGPDRHIVSYFTTPQKDEIYYIAVTPEPDFKLESWSAKGDRDTMLSAFAGFHPNIRALLAASPDIRKWALLDRDPVAKWGEGGVVLLGDACHPMPPYIAQGAGTALEDAVVLARCVERCGPHRIRDAFAVYEATRKDRTAQIQTTARQNNWLRVKTDTDWIWAYDAWNAPLAI